MKNFTSSLNSFTSLASISFLALSLGLLACSKTLYDGSGNSSGIASLESSSAFIPDNGYEGLSDLQNPINSSRYPAKLGANLRISLTDKPKGGLAAVMVDIDHLELIVSKEDPYSHEVKRGRVSFGYDLGQVDLLTLQDGMLLPIADLSIPTTVKIQQIRLILKPDNHFAVLDDASFCSLKTPSADKTGIKLIFQKPVTFEPDYNYSMILDFDAKESVILLGNSKCLLKPVLKVKSSTRIIAQSNNPVEESLISGNGNTNISDDGSGFVNTVENPPIPLEELTTEELIQF